MCSRRGQACSSGCPVMAWLGLGLSLPCPGWALGARVSRRPLSLGALRQTSAGRLWGCEANGPEDRNIKCSCGHHRLPGGGGPGLHRGGWEPRPLSFPKPSGWGPLTNGVQALQPPCKQAPTAPKHWGTPALPRRHQLHQAWKSPSADSSS